MACSKPSGLSASTGWARSLRELESKLRAEERYMVVEKSPFPDFVLEDAGV